jgi:hypothetical protein
MGVDRKLSNKVGPPSVDQLTTDRTSPRDLQWKYVPPRTSSLTQRSNNSHRLIRASGDRGTLRSRDETNTRQADWVQIIPALDARVDVMTYCSPQTAPGSNYTAAVDNPAGKSGQRGTTRPRMRQVHFTRYQIRFCRQSVN